MAALDYAEGRGHCPVLLEIGILCDAYHTPPDHYGIDNPRTIRSMYKALNVMQIASYRKESGDTVKWDKANPTHSKFLKAIRQQSNTPLAPYEVEVILPEREKK